MTYMSGLGTKSYIHTDLLGQQLVKKKGIGRGNISIFLPTVIVIIFFILFFAWCRIQNIKIGYKIAEANKIQKAMLQENTKLKLQKSDLTLPARIESIIEKRKLGLKIPDDNQFIRIK